MQIRATIKPYLDTRRKKASGQFPVKLRITYLRKQQYYPLGFDLNREDFEDLINEGTKLSPAKKRFIPDLRRRLNIALGKASTISQDLRDFSFAAFAKRFEPSQRSTTDIYGAFDAMIAGLEAEGRVGTASNYTSSRNSLKKFKPNLTFRDVTPELLQKYHHYLLAEGKSISTVGIYLRPLRSVFNRAIDDGLIQKESCYPFGKKRYLIPTSRNVKKALTVDEIKAFSRYPAIPGSSWEKAKDLFLFSFHCNGMNMKDIALLTYDNIDGNNIVFYRAKTARTNKGNTLPIRIRVTPLIRSIIDRWGNPEDGNNYIFPILTAELSPRERMAKIQQLTKMVNRYIKLIAGKLNINKPVTSYYARHSFATILKRKGMSTEVISESLGHSNVQTTSSYLDSLDDQVLTDISEILAGCE
jgi:integrase/recombinase XerD